MRWKNIQESGAAPPIWLWNVNTHEVVFTDGLDHTAFILDNQHLFGLNGVEPDRNDFGHPKRYFDPKVLTAAMQNGWVRCHTNSIGHCLYINAIKLSDAQACIRYYEKMYPTFTVDIGFEYNEFSKYLSTPREINQYLRLRDENPLTEGLLVIPPKMHEQIDTYLTFYILWWARDRFRGQEKSLPEHYRAFLNLVKEFDIELPAQKYQPSKDMSVHLIRAATSGMPANYQKLVPASENIRFAIYWKHNPANAGVWLPDKKALVIYPYALDYLRRYPSSSNHPDDLAIALAEMRETATHELRHMVQTMFLADYPEQRHMKPEYGKRGDEYYASPIEFDPMIGSAVREFLHLWSIYAENGSHMSLSRAIKRFTGAEKANRLSAFEANRFFVALKRTAPERYKIAIRKFITAVRERMA